MESLSFQVDACNRKESEAFIEKSCSRKESEIHATKIFY